MPIDDENSSFANAVSAAIANADYVGTVANVSDRSRERNTQGTTEAIVRKTVVIDKTRVQLPGDMVITPCSSMWLPNGKVIGCRSYRANKKKEDYHVQLQISVCVSGQRDERREEDRRFFGEAILFFGCTHNDRVYHLVPCRVYPTEQRGRFHISTNNTAAAKVVVVDASAVTNMAGVVKVDDNTKYYIHDDDDPSVEYANDGNLRHLS